MGWFNGLFPSFFGAARYVKNALRQWYTMSGIGPVFNDYSGDLSKLQAILSNPALLKVISLQCDLFSMGKVYVYSLKDKERQNDPAIDRLNDPNPMQEGSAFLWDYMFWLCMGNAYLYMDSKLVSRENAPMYWLIPHKIDWPIAIDRMKDKLILSQSRLKEIDALEATYRYEDGSTFKFPLSKLIAIADLSNGMGNWWKGYSRIDALYKVVSNSEAALDAKNINVRFSGKFLVAGQNDPEDVKRIPMGQDEKEDIETKVNKDEKQVHAIRSMIDIKRFVDDMKAMPLDEAFKADYFMIGTMFGIPRDVLEAYQSATYENQEKARASHVAYTLDPKGTLLASALTKYWGYTAKKVVISWDHLPFVQVFEKDRVAVQMQKINAFGQMLNQGISVEDANKYLDTNFTVDEAKREANRKPKPGAAA